MCLAKPDAKKSHALRDRYLTGFPPSARMTGWGAVVNRKAMCPFEKTMVNNCHAKRDATGGYATLDPRLPARMTNNDILVFHL
ncbi:hypothetical protein [Candidatus Spongiihabitans sp.]|uniref:hypothetical protein n=1 Tax=Candidatus Spongiihabitans sp. TaxID=3101308 RepID=UPI003C7C90C1